MKSSKKSACSAALIVAMTSLFSVAGQQSAHATPAPAVAMSGSMQFDQPEGGPIGLTYTLRLGSWSGGEGKNSFLLTHSTNLVNPTVVSRSAHISLNPASLNTPTSEGVQEQKPLDGSLQDDTLVVHYDIVTLSRAETITATGSANLHATPSVTSSEEAPLTILSGAPPTAVAGSTYSASVMTSRFSRCTYDDRGLESTGLFVNPTTGEITGAPIITGTFPFSVTARDTDDRTEAVAHYVMHIVGTVPMITTADGPPSAVIGQKYAFSISSTGSPAPQYSVTAGGLPNGLSLNRASGLVSGTPTAAGVYRFRVTAANVAGSDQRDFEISVAHTSDDS